MTDTAKIKLSRSDEGRIVAFIEHIVEHRPDDLLFRTYTVRDTITGLELWTDSKLMMSVHSPFESKNFRWHNEWRIRRAIKKVFASRPYRGTALVDEVLSKDPSFTARLVAA